MSLGSGVTRDAVFEVFGLTDIKHVTGLVKHPVNTGRCRQTGQPGADCVFKLSDEERLAVDFVVPVSGQ